VTAPRERGGTSRRAELIKARQSRRPSRLGTQAGTAAEPDHVFADDAGFPGLLARAWRAAVAAPDLATAVETLLTLGGHVPADVQLRALRSTDEAALVALLGRTWRADRAEAPARPADDLTGGSLVGEIGLTTSGRLVVGAPSRSTPGRGRPDGPALVAPAMPVPWSAAAVAAYQRELGVAMTRLADGVADCRDWLASHDDAGRDELVEHLVQAAIRTAPFVLYQEDQQYTNFRDRNTLTGKTLWPGHPDCTLSGLRGRPLPQWSDSEAVLVVCLTLLVRSASFARIEEANGTQLTLDHVALLLERTRRKYDAVPGHAPLPAAATGDVRSLMALAAALRERRGRIGRQVQLYRTIHGALMHKIECVAGPSGQGARDREDALCAELAGRLPLAGSTLEELGADVAADPSWLALPHGEFATGLESLVYETVAAATRTFDADFAMSRGIRSLAQLVQALLDEDWARITQWDIAEFFCCVVPGADAHRYFDDSRARLADIAWSYSSRMRYNSWHFIAGNLPKVPVVEARDHFVPPTIPDIAYFSDQHHHGHVAGRVRFTIRSPQAVDVLDRRFDGFIDLRLLRCDGEPFDEQDLIAAHRTSAFIARATGLAADLVACDKPIEVTSFDSDWHWSTITGDRQAVVGRPG
jgi:hypothetical protein